MNLSFVLIILLCVLSFCTGLLIHFFVTRRKMKSSKAKLQEYSSKAESLSRNYDDYRRKYLDLDDRYGELKNMEQTYRVAYQEWKSKYETLRTSIGDRENEANLSPKDLQKEILTDDEDHKILYLNWKKKSKKLAKTVIEMQKKHSILEKELKKAKEENSEMIQMKTQLRNLKKNIIQITEKFDRSNTNPSKDSGSLANQTSANSDVFDLSE